MPDATSSTTDGPIGHQTAQDIAWFDDFLASQRSALRRTLDASDTPEVQGPIDGQPLPDFGGPYQATSLIGEGATGQVFLAADREFSRTVAIKVSHLGRGDDEANVFQRLLAREQRHIGQLEHECIVRVYRGGRLDDGRLWYAMEHVPGEPLTEYASRHRLDLKCAVQLFVQVTEAIAELHNLGIMHADLKPAHILITSRGQPKVIDFGLARVIGTPIESSPQISNNAAHSCIGGGTPGYRAPELAKGLRGDLRSDIYSMGVILHELATGSVPVQPHEVPHNSACNSRRPGDALSLVKSRCPAALHAVIRRCMADSPDDRYPNAKCLATDLSHWLHDFPVEAFCVSLTPGRALTYRAKTHFRRSRKFIAVAGIVAVLALILARGAVEISRSTARNEALIIRDQQRTAEDKRRGIAEQEQADARLHRDAIVDTRQLFMRGRIDDASRALARVPYSRRGIEYDIFTRQLAQFPTRHHVIGMHDWGVSAILGSDRCLVSAGHDGRLVVWSMSGGDALSLRAGRWSSSLGRYLQPFEVDPDVPVAGAVITSLAWINHGHTFVSVDLAGDVVRWNTSEKQGQLLAHHQRPLLSVAVNPETRMIVFGDDAGTLTICSVEGQVASSMAYDDDGITALASAGPDRWWVGHETGSVRIVDDDGVQIASATLPGPIWQVAAAADDSVAVACQSPEVRLLRCDPQVSELREVVALKVPSSEPTRAQAVHAVQISPAEDRLFAVDDLGKLACFELPSGSLAFSSDDQGAFQLSAAAMQSWPTPLRRRSAGVAFTAQGEAFATAGGDTLIKLWRKNPPHWHTELQVSAHPRFTFHETHSGDLLWVIDDTGQLALIDVHSGDTCDRVSVGEDTVADIAAAKRANLVVTGCGRTVHFWREDRQHIRSAYTPITFDDDIDSLAIDSECHHLAVQLVSGQVEVRALPGGRAIASRMFEGTSAGRLEFDGSGGHLALLAGTTTHVLDATTLETQASFEMSVGKGTALAWHPTKSGVIVTGDRVGRMASRPEASWPTQAEEWAGGNPVVDLAFTANGNRMLAATSTGRLIVIEPDRLGPLHSFEVAPGVASPATQMALSPNGQFAAIGHEDGTVHLLRLAESLPPQPMTTHMWVERVHATGAEVPNARVHPWSAAIDAQGFLHAIYLQTVPDTPADWRLVLGRETSAGWQAITLRDYGALPQRGVDALDRSHTLRIVGDRLFAFAKLDVDASKDHATAPHLIVGTVEAGRDRVDDKLPVNLNPHAGFDPFLVPMNRALPSVVHFTHAGHYLLRSTHDGAHWRTTRMGRQGDGYRFHAVANESHLYLLFRPTRFNGDRALPVVLAVPLTAEVSRSVETRDHFSTEFYPTVLGLTLLQNGEPAILYRTRSPDAHQQLRLALRQGNRWQHHTIFNREPLQLAMSDLLMSPRGEVAFAAASHVDGDVWHITVADGRVNVERVLRGPGRASTNLPQQVDCALHYAPDGRPVVLVVCSSPDAGYLRTFRPDFQVPSDTSPHP